MYIIVTIFLTSLVGLCGMILYRIWEIKKERILPRTNFNEPFFSKEEIKMLTQKCYSCIPKEYLAHVREKVIVFSKMILQKIMIFIENAPVTKHIRRFTDAVRGRHVIQNSTKPSSAFIQDILARKEQVRSNMERGGV